MIVTWMGWGSGIERVVNTFKLYFGAKTRTEFGTKLDERDGGGEECCHKNIPIF